jgi:hypothetical protein
MVATQQVWKSNNMGDLKQGMTDSGLDLQKAVLNTMQKDVMTYTKLKALLLETRH